LKIAKYRKLTQGYATLDSREKQCTAKFADGKELKNKSQVIFPSGTALFFPAAKGKPESRFRWL